MSVICPTITAYNPHDFREQMERIAPFASRVHIDFMDGDFASPKSVDLAQAWWPENLKADLHIMYRQPESHLDAAIRLKPNLIILHAEAEGNFAKLCHKLSEAGIKVGLALLQATPVEEIVPVLGNIDSVLVFSGNLGHHGGRADLKLLDKIKLLYHLKPDIEFGWDGGIDDANAALLMAGGVDVLNVGAFIHDSSDPAAAYAKLKQITQRQK